ncbi:MAG TPA: apolipoprotein N-acyltransferase [Egibacteraceae bacterium]|nr:apolipoprotein N-acyltransferase [Egibacteraceae bacterium]
MLTSRLPRAGRVVLAGGAGVLATLGHPPANLPLATVIGYSALLVVLRGSGAAAGAAGGLSFGATMFAVLLSWSARFGAPAVAALAVSQAVFLVPLGVVSSSRLPRWRWVAATSATLTLSEAVRARGPLGGFEWGQLGYVWHATPVRGLAALVGVLGLTALTAAASAVLATTQRPRRLPRAGTAAVVVAAVVMVGVAAAREWTAPAGGLDVAVVQVAPVCVGPVVRCPDEDELLFEAFTRATRESGARPALFVWGEAALGGDSLERAGRRAVTEAGVRSKLLAGVTSPAGPGRFFNSNVLYDSAGAVVYRYDKRHPVPFGEYVPWRSVVGGVADVDTLVPSDMMAGGEPGRVPVNAAVLGTVSSFEASFSREVRAAAADPTVHGVAVLTSQASYGPSPVSAQFLAMARMRAAELGKPVVVAATTGRSALFDARGGVVDVGPLLQPAVLEVRMGLRSGTTPFGRSGDAPLIAASAFTLAVAAAAGRVRRLVSAARRRAPLYDTS